MIHGNKERLRVPRKEKVKEDDWNQDRTEELCDLQMKEIFQNDINEDPQKTAGTVVDDPCRDEEVSCFALIRIAASWAAIKWREPITQRFGAECPQKDR